MDEGKTKGSHEEEVVVRLNCMAVASKPSTVQIGDRLADHLCTGGRLWVIHQDSEILKHSRSEHRYEVHFSMYFVLVHM